MGICNGTTSLLLLLLLLVVQSQELFWCGSTYDDASTACVQSCPLGYGCADGLICFAGVTSCSIDGGSVSGSSISSSGSDALTFVNTPTAATVAATTIITTPASSPVITTQSSWSSSSSTNSNSNSLANSLDGLTGVAAVEATFQSMKDVIDNNIFLYETPAMEWEPSSVYRFDGFFGGMQVMHSEGVAGKKLYMGGDCAHCHMYGLINVAAFLAQAMKETIRYDACDENSWDRVGDEKMYPISNSCGQLGQSYQDYHCSEEEKHMECEVDPNMTITAVTNAKWWGAPGPMMCTPKSIIPQTGYWDFNYACDNPWATPPESCDAYEGQKGGKAINDVPYPNGAGRTDVEGCCWWGRGVIQTSGVCNFGKLNYFLGKRAADEGRESRYPDVDFCKDPETICWSQEHSELKWIAGFFYWMNEVQEYDEGGWNYINELRSFVDGGMVDEGFINAVSGIVNRGCHNPPCGTGDLDGGPERAENFMKVVDEMRFAFVEVTELTSAPETIPPAPPTFPPVAPLTLSLPPSLPPSISPETSLPVISPQFAPPSPLPTFPSLLTGTLRPTPLPKSGESLPPTLLPSPEPDISTFTPSADQDVSTSLPSSLETAPSTEEAFLSNAEVAGPDEIRYSCGAGYQVDQSDTSIPVSAEVAFDYEVHNGIDVPVSEALKDVKTLILQDIADLIQCDITYSGRRLQNGFENVIGLWSTSYDPPDADAPGCIVDVDTSNPTTCTPVSGSFTFFAESGTSKASLGETAQSLLAHVQTSMNSGQYESGIVAKAIFIGEREQVLKSPALAEAMTIQTKGESKSNKGLLIAIYVLSSACILLIGVLCIIARSRQEKSVDARFGRGYSSTFRSVMTQGDGGHDPESQRGSMPFHWQQNQNRIIGGMSSQSLWQREKPHPNIGPHHRSMPLQRPNQSNTNQTRREVASSVPATTAPHFIDQHEDMHGIAALSSLWNHRSPNGQFDEAGAYPSVGEIPPIIHQNPAVVRNKSGGDESSSDSSDSTSDSEETEPNIEPVPPSMDDVLNANLQSLNSFDGGNHTTPAFNNSAKSLQSESSSAREDRQERLARARARSAGRQQRRLS
ncbi:hypothetical protein ACHAXH_002848 [Discostella pseudostelligera]